MHTAQTRHSAGRQIRLISRRSAKRWGRWFVFVWLGMWLSAALLPCCEVEAAVVRHEQALHPDCGHPAEQAPDSGGGHKTGACLDIAAPAPASAEILAGPSGGNLTQPALGISAPTHVLPPLPALTLPVAYRSAPPPVAVYLRSQRLLI
jgi:hypothetical protein